MASKQLKAGKFTNHSFPPPLSWLKSVISCPKNILTNFESCHASAILTFMPKLTGVSSCLSIQLA